MEVSGNVTVFGGVVTEVDREVGATSASCWDRQPSLQHDLAIVDVDCLHALGTMKLAKRTVPAAAPYMSDLRNTTGVHRKRRTSTA